jgi:hypothetical protein
MGSQVVSQVWELSDTMFGQVQQQQHVPRGAVLYGREAPEERDASESAHVLVLPRDGTALAPATTAFSVCR